MSKTLALREIITTELNRITGATYYRQAPSTATMPYKVYNLSRMSWNDDTARNNYELTVDLWDHATDQKTLDSMADSLEAILNNANIPTADVLPTFYASARYPVEDNDKDIQHIQLTFEIHLYERL